MNDSINQEILSELRKLRKLAQLQTWFLAVVVIGGICSLFLVHYGRMNALRERTQEKQEQAYSWKAVDTACDQRDFSRALSLAQALVARRSYDYFGHAYLGNIYLALNDLTNCAASYLRAYELWPSEENDKNLAAIRKRLAMENRVKSR